MRICFVDQQTQINLQETQEKRVDVFLFGGMKEVDYEKELKGETNFFKRATLFSKTAQAVVVQGCITNTKGHRRKSALVAEAGTLLGVSDMLHAVDDEKVSVGALLRVYETSVGRIGVVVGDDLKFPEIIKTLSDCGADVVVCVYPQMHTSLPTLLVRASAFFFGIPVLFCSSGYTMYANTGGEIGFASPQSPCFFDVPISKQYHLVQTRMQGKLRD